MTSHTKSMQRWTAILGTTFCALITGMGYLLWQDTKAIDDQKPLTDLASSVSIQRPGFTDIDLLRNSNGWQMLSPCNLDVNEQRLTPLLDALTPATYQYRSTEVDLEAAGLVAPLATVYINEQEYRIGNTDLRGERRYVQRGNAVEFAPEWVLSLVNGGITALSKLELFTTPLQQLVRVDETGSSRDLSSKDTLSAWQNISAQQIVSWPPPNTELTLGYQLQTTDINNNKKTLLVYNTDQFVAIRPEGGACAYILNIDSLPDS